MEIWELCRKVTELGRQGRRTLVYSLLAGEGGCGVAVAVLETGEEVRVSGLTPSPERAMGLLDLLATNFVTPVALLDVVEEWLAR